MTNVGVVVVTYRSAATIQACLSSFAGAYAARVDVVVVDNDSPDNSAALAEAAGVHVIRQSENVGYGAANNIGVAALAPDVDVIVLANPDTVWPVGSLDTLVAALESDASLGLVSPALINTDDSMQPFVEADLSLTSVVLGLLRLRKPIRPQTPSTTSDTTTDVDWLHTAAAVLPAAVVRELGGFDERFFLFAEDADLCRRVRASGKRVTVAPWVRVAHVGGASVDATHNDDTAAALRTRALATYLDKFEGKLARRAFGAVGTIVYGLGGHRGQAREAWKALVG